MPIHIQKARFASTMLIAAAIAPVLTVAFATLGLSAFDIAWVARMQSASPAAQAIYDHPTVVAELGRALLDLAFTPLVGVLFGFVGALIFLTPALAAARLFRRRFLAFTVAGAAAGLVHSLVGLAYNSGAELPANSAGAHAFGWIGLIGGFLLMGSPRPEAIPTVFVSAMLAGAISGAASARLLKPEV